MKVSIITSLQLLAAVAIAAPLTADFSSISKVANAKRQDLDLPPAIENCVNTLGRHDDAVVEEDLTSMAKRQDDDGLSGALGDVVDTPGKLVGALTGSSVHKYPGY